MFAIGFSTVAVGQTTLAYFGLRPVLQFERNVEPAARPAPPKRKPRKSYSDYLTIADRAFRKMDRSCSAADRKMLGHAFHDLVVAMASRNARRRETGGVEAEMITVRSQPEVEIRIFAQIIDAARRNVLTHTDFPTGSVRKMYLQMKRIPSEKIASINRINLDAPTANFRATRCQPF
jgi:hypothetical protein